MEIKKMKINLLKSNPNNPRVIKDDKYHKLYNSLQEFPEMLYKRPIIVYKNDDGDFVVLGGNMRLKALKELGYKEVPVIVADDWSEEQRNQFLIKDNLNYGDWDWEQINNGWNTEELEEWGLDVYMAPVEVDYSILEEENLDTELENLSDGVKKAIQIEFEPEHYETAQELIKFFRDNKVYVGGLLIEKLKYEKDIF